MTEVDIKKRIEEDFKIDLSVKSRKREYVYPRAIFFKLCREFTDESTQELAGMLGLKCHASVLNSINSTFYDAMYEIKYKKYYEKMKRELNSKPSLEVENDRLKIKVGELTELIEFYRNKVKRYGAFG